MSCFQVDAGGVCVGRLFALVAPVLVLFGLGVASNKASGQVAWGTNGHTLRWRAFTTPHFQVIFTAGGDSAAARAAWCAERAYQYVAADLGVGEFARIPLVLNTVEDVANGFASPLGHFLWVWSKPDPKTTAGPLDWLSRVVTHEFAHMATYRAVRDGLGLYWEGLALGTMPMWFLEGVAQVESEPVDVHRELLLRVAALDSSLLSLPHMNGFIGANRIEGRLLYEQGQSLLRYLQRERGRATLRRLVAAHRGNPLNFSWTLKRTVSRSSRHAYWEWRRDLQRFYRAHWGARERLERREPIIRLPFQGVYSLRWRPGDSTCYAAVVVRDFREEVPRLVLVQSGRFDSLRVLAEPYVGTHFAWSPDGGRVVYNKLHVIQGGILTDDLFVVDLATGREKLLTWGGRFSDPTWSPNGRWIACVQQLPDRSRLVRLAVEDAAEPEILVDLGPGTVIYEPDWSPNGKVVAFAYRDAQGTRGMGLRWLAFADSIEFLTGPGERRSPAFSPDGRLLAFVDSEEGAPDLAVLDLQTRRMRRLTRVVGGLFNPSWHPDGRKLAVVNFERTDRIEVVLLRSERKPPANLVPLANLRPPWHAVHPEWWVSDNRPLGAPGVLRPSESQPYHSFFALRLWIFLPFVVREGGHWRIGGALGFAEPTLRQQLVLQGLADRRGNWAANYTNSTGLVRWSLEGSRHWRNYGPWAVVRGDTLCFSERADRFVLRGDLGFNLGRNLLANHAVAFQIGLESVAAEQEKELAALPSWARPFRGHRVWVGLGYGYAREIPSVDSDIHPTEGIELAVNASWAPAVLSQLPQRGAAAQVVRRWRRGRQIFAFRLRVGGVTGAFPRQSPPAISARLVRGLRSDLPGSRWTLWTAEWRFPLVDDLGGDLPYLYLEKVVGALFCDGARVGGVVWNGRQGWITRDPQSVLTAGAVVRLRFFPLHKLGFVLGAGWGRELRVGGQRGWFVRVGPVF